MSGLTPLSLEPALAALVRDGVMVTADGLAEKRAQRTQVNV